ncbi:uncharacterized protein LOC116106997 [Pistacia vera]|uniref:uncharacterized protein LOC116106997 n=1 Tax=Pistacia vera TaxID=55513 RepID=UPI0012637C78|nr:uncharacterized protein LOC116106997 [Pistacia vera]
MVVQGFSGDATPPPQPPPYFSDERDGHGRHSDGDDTSFGISSEELQLYRHLANKSFHNIQMKYSYHQNYDLQQILRNPELHLKLTKSQSFINLIQDTLVPQQQIHHHHHHGAVGRPRKTDFVSQQVTEKLKASNFSASLLRIGKWERVSIHEGDLVAKCYYAKKKLVWEFLERTLKRKIEIQWGDILAIRATMNENEPGILQIELKNPPTFHHETDPQPRKHTNWKTAADFTDGQALVWRRHYLTFPPGVLDKPFEKLLQCDDRLNELSRQPFPSLKSPYFYHQTIYEPMELNFSFHGQRPHFNPALQLSLAQLHNTSYVAQPVPSYQQTITQRRSISELASPDSVMEFGENPEMAFWGQGMNNFADNLVGNQVQGLLHVPSITPADVFYPNNNNNNYIESGSSCRRNFDTDTCLNHIEKALMSDAHADYRDQGKFSQCSLESMATMEAMINQPTDGNNLFCNTNATNNTIYGQNMPIAMHIDLSSNQPSNETTGGLIFQPWMASMVTEIRQPISAVMPTQVTNEIPVSYYDYATDNHHHHHHHHHHHGQNSWP